MTFEREEVEAYLSRVVRMAYDAGRKAALSDEVCEERSECPYEHTVLWDAWHKGYWEEGTVVDADPSGAIVTA